MLHIMWWHPQKPGPGLYLIEASDSDDDHDGLDSIDDSEESIERFPIPYIDNECSEGSEEEEGSEDEEEVSEA